MRHGSRIFTAALPLVFLAGHAGTLALVRNISMLTSFAWLAAAPLLAGLACLHRGRRDGYEGWLPLGLAMLCWAGGMIATMAGTLLLDAAEENQFNMLLFVLYGVPIIFALASPEDDKWPVRLIDAALAVAMGCLYYVHVDYLTSVASSPAETQASLQLMFDIENLYVALFAALRFFASTVRRAVFFRATMHYAIVYLLCAGYINHFEPNTPFGNWADLIIDLPFVLLAWHALAARDRQDIGIWGGRTFARIVRAGSALLIPTSLLTVSVLLVSYTPRIAIAGCVAAAIGYGVRATLVQLRNFDEQDLLARLSHVDALTGIANRRRFDEALAYEWGRRRQVTGQLALLMIDIDHFKALNDRFGHAVGDERLCSVARVLANCARRDGDLVARYGGEEFAAILPGMEPHEAIAVAERMRSSIEELGLVGGGSGVVTVSIGLACAQVLDADEHALIAAADHALYEAKREGRNRVAHRTTIHLMPIDNEMTAADGRAA